MSLLNILTDINREGASVVTAAEQASRLADINNAAQEIHNSFDIPEAMDEKVFDMNVDSQQVAFPAYVDRIRNFRYYDIRQSVVVDHPANRWNESNSAENELWYLQWRQKRVTALSREITNQSVLTFAIPSTEATGIDITITGKTDKSHRISETVTIAAGELEVDTENNWVDVESIVKSRITQFDIIVTDVEGNEMARLLNSELLSQFTVWQIADTEGFVLPDNTSGVEIFFKYKFQPFVNNADTFHGTNRYDKVIFWKYMEHMSRKTEDAVMFAGKCRAAMSQLVTDESANIRRKIHFTSSTYWNMPYRSRTNYRYG